MNRIVGRTGMVFLAAASALLVASPVLAYNNGNADQILLRRLNKITCGTKIRLAADVLNASGGPVRNAQVRFRLDRGGRLGPDSVRLREHTVTDREGRARPPANSEGARLPYLRIRCGSNPGYRTVRAHVPQSDAAARLKIWCGPARGCDGGTSASSESTSLRLVAARLGTAPGGPTSGVGALVLRE